MHGSTHHYRKDEGSKHLARGVLGPFALGVGSVSPRAPRAVQAERRWRDVSDVYLPIDQPRSLLRLLEQGPESQSASAICAGGVSTVISSSEFDAHILNPLEASCHRSNRALPSMAKPPIVGTACSSSVGEHN